MQLDLFNKVQPIPIEKISWSFSKMGTLRQCPRRYYYQYYGSKKRLASKEPDKERLIFLSSLSNKYLVSGSIIHTAVATYLKKRSEGDEWNLARLVGWGKKLLAESIGYSQNKRNGTTDIRQYPPEIIKEIYYSEVDLSGFRAEVEEKIVSNLINFMESERFATLKKGASQPGAMIERKTVFTLDEATKVDGQIDVAFKTDNELTIADWKTGKVEFEDTSLQLLAYALWAIEKEGASSNQIRIQKAYLQEDKLENLEFSEEHLFRARTRIFQDAEVMRELHEFGKEGVSEAFTPCKQDKICTSCPFEEICPK